MQEAVLEKHDTEHLTEELADVHVILEQIRRAFDIDTKELSKYMQQKVDRQIKRIKIE